MLRILVTAYNCESYFEKSLRSIQDQSVTDWHCYITNDVSIDQTAMIADRFAQKDARFTCIHNQHKRWQCGNYQEILRRREVSDEDIVISIDGDDWLPDRDVFQRILSAYSSPEVWITWGSFISVRRGKVKQGHSLAVSDVTKLRNQAWNTSHLRTWKVFLWRNVNDEDLRCPTGEYWRTAGDMAFMFPMLEMATNTHAKFLSETNYVYNLDNPIGDSKINRVDQLANETIIRSMKPYTPLIWG